MKLTLVIFLLSSLLTSCSGGKNSTGYSLINDMMYSVAYEAYSKNPVYKDGQTNQLAVEGTIARGFIPHPTDENGNPVLLENKQEMTDYTWQRGQMLFDSTCASCHGAQGAGDGLVVTQGAFPIPPDFNSRRFKYSGKDKYPAGEIYNVITFGRGNMPPHAQQLYPEDRWYVAEYVRERLMVRGK